MKSEKILIHLIIMTIVSLLFSSQSISAKIEGKIVKDTTKVVRLVFVLLTKKMDGWLVEREQF